MNKSVIWRVRPGRNLAEQYILSSALLKLKIGKTKPYSVETQKNIVGTVNNNQCVNVKGLIILNGPASGKRSYLFLKG